MKAKSRFLGIDDAPFRFSDETVPVVGVVVQAPSYIEGVLTTLAEVDGHDATERIASMVRRSRYRAGLAAILIDGTAVGGFNVIDIDAVRAAVDRPVVTVTRKTPNLGSIETALRRRFDDWQERLATIRRHEIEAIGTGHGSVWVTYVGASQPRSKRRSRSRPSEGSCRNRCASPISSRRGSSEANRGDAPDSVRPRTSHLMGNRRRAAIPPNASSFWPAS